MTSIRPLLVAGLLVLSAVGLPAVALPAGATSTQSCTLDAGDADPLVLAYNANLDRVPDFLRGQAADHRIDVLVTSPDGERRFAVTTDTDGSITSFEETAATDPTLRLETSRSTICDVLAADDPAAAAETAYGNDEIEIVGVGIVNSVKIFIVKLVRGVVELLTRFI